MTTVKRFIKDLEDVAKTLKKVGIKAYVEPNPNSDSDPEFLLGLDSSRLSLNLIINFDRYATVSDDGKTDDEGETIKFDTQLEVLETSKKHRQAVLRLKEPARTLVRNVAVFGPIAFSKKDLTKKQIETIELNASHPSEFPVRLPEGTRYTSKLIDRDPSRILSADASKAQYICEVTATVPKSDQYFLVGFDEEHMFISCLPKKVKTVEEAHAALMPPQLKRIKGVLRQGEFFLVPLNGREWKALDKELRKLNQKSFWGERLNSLTFQRPVETKDGNYSDHIAAVSTWINTGKNNTQVQVVTGVMYNDRHFTRLDGWYKVVPNLELPNPTDETTWD